MPRVEVDGSSLFDPGPLKKWLHRHRPEVVVAKAAYVLPLITDLGLKIPRDIAFADLFLEDTRGGVAGVRQNHDRVGGCAVEIVARPIAAP